MKTPAVAFPAAGVFIHLSTGKHTSGEGAMDTLERILARADVGGEGDCWPWLAADNGHGYGVTRLGGGSRGAHRVVYSLMVGEIPRGHELHHACANRRCVNPAHLIPLSAREHGRVSAIQHGCRREPGTTCSRGHLLTPENTYHRKSRSVYECRHCRAIARGKASA